MACPPGAEDSRSLSVYFDKPRAETLQQQLELIIRNFPLKDWQQQLLSPKYLELLNSLPPDDDEVVGILERRDGNLRDGSTWS